MVTGGIQKLYTLKSAEPTVMNGRLFVGQVRYHPSDTLFRGLPMFLLLSLPFDSVYYSQSAGFGEFFLMVFFKRVTASASHA